MVDRLAYIAKLLNKNLFLPEADVNRETVTAATIHLIFFGASSTSSPLTQPITPSLVLTRNQ
jgi:hypothetical protein